MHEQKKIQRRNACKKNARNYSSSGRRDSHTNIGHGFRLERRTLGPAFGDGNVIRHSTRLCINPACGIPLSRTAKFCEECGTRVALAVCSNPACGLPLSRTAKFCEECGTRVAPASTPPSQPEIRLPQTETCALQWQPAVGPSPDLLRAVHRSGRTEVDETRRADADVRRKSQELDALSDCRSDSFQPPPRETTKPAPATRHRECRRRK